MIISIPDEQIEEMVREQIDKSIRKKNNRNAGRLYQ